MPLDATTPHQNVDRFEPQRSLRLHVLMPDGGWVAPPAAAGMRVLDALEQFGLPLRPSSKAIRIGAGWRQRVTDTLDAGLAAGNQPDQERVLSPSLVMTADLDGLEIELDWDALVPQTYWIAG